MSDVQTQIEEDEVKDDLLEDPETGDADELIEDATEDNVEEGEIDGTEQHSPFGVWDSSIESKRIKMLLYGLSGMGKTTMAATFPRPLFLDLEGGMLSVRKFRPLRYPHDPSESISSYPQVVDFYNLVRAEKNPQFDTIVIDSLNELQLLVTQYVVAKYTGVKRQYNDQMTLADYGKANRDFSKVVRLFLNLPFHVVFTAASTQRDFGAETDVQIAPKFVGQQVGPDVQRMMDMIGYCYAKEMPDKTTQHYVSFKMSTKYLAKDRIGIVRQDIPNNFDALISNTKETKSNG